MAARCHRAVQPDATARVVGAHDSNPPLVSTHRVARDEHDAKVSERSGASYPVPSEWLPPAPDADPQRVASDRRSVGKIGAGGAQTSSAATWPTLGLVVHVISCTGAWVEMKLIRSYWSQVSRTTLGGAGVTTGVGH